MCGFKGWINTKDDLKKKKKIIKKMTNTLKYRGPDQTGYYLKAKDANTSGTIIEYQLPDHEPLPKKILVIGINTIINNKQGIDLKMFTNVPTIELIIVFGKKPLKALHTYTKNIITTSVNTETTTKLIKL